MEIINNNNTEHKTVRRDSDKILFIDILATGTNIQKCGIYGIGGILVTDTPTRIQEIARFEMRVRPYEKAKIHDNSLWRSGTRRSDLISFEDEKTVLGKFTAILDRIVNVKDPSDKIHLSGYNTSAFDALYLKDFFTRNGNEDYRNYFHVQAYDIMSYAALALKWDRRKMPDFQLDTAAKFLGVEPQYDENYSCINNAETCMEMYRIIKQRFGVGIIDPKGEAAEIEVNF